MVKADDRDGGGGDRGSSRRAKTAAALFEVNKTLERLNAAKQPVPHPASFLLERLRTIELWRQSGVKLNLVQLGASLVRGVLRRDHHGTHPLRLFDPIDDTPLHPSHSPHTSNEDGDLLRHKSLSTPFESARVEKTPQDQNGRASTGHHLLSTTPKAQGSHDGVSHEATHEHRHVPHRDDTSTPSVARIVLVQAASEASTELYMGVLVGCFSYGVSSLAQRDVHKAAASAESTKTANTVNTTSTSSHQAPSAQHHDTSTATTHGSSGAAGGLMFHPTTSSATARTATTAPAAHLHAPDRAHHHHTAGGAAELTRSDASTRQCLSSEAAHALHEVHRAAREIIHLMYADVKKLNVLFAQTAPDLERLVQQQENVQDEAGTSPHDATPSGLEPEMHVHDLCLRLTHLAANLYSLIAFLDFFSVEAELAEKMKAESAALEGHHNGRGAAAATQTHPPVNTPADKSTTSFASGFTSAMAAIAGVNFAAYVNNNNNNNSSSTTTATTTATTASVNPLHPRTATADRARHAGSGGTPPSTARAGDGVSSAPHRVKSTYTVEHFQTLFSVEGHLPRCVWDVLAAATAVLSQCDVSWSLTHADPAASQMFNATATVVFSEAQLSLLRQLHRLCRRFAVLRQRVYGLFPVSPVRFKVKQMLDWPGFLYGDDKTFRSTHDGFAELSDFHEDKMHSTYAVRPKWAVSAANRELILHVAATPYAPPLQAVDEEEERGAAQVREGVEAGPTNKETTATATAPKVGGRPAPSTTSFPSRSGTSSAAESYASKMPVSSLLATLASVGTSSYAAMNRGAPYANSVSSFNTRRNKFVGHGSGSDGGQAAAHASGAGSGSSGGGNAVTMSTVPGWVGLRNSGNTCFLNSVVQLLNSAALFRDNLMLRVQQSVFHRTASSTAPLHTSGGASAPCTDGAAATPAAVKAPDLATLFKKYGCRLALVLLLGELQWRARQHHENHPVLPDYLDAQLPVPFNDHRQHDASEFLHALLDQLDAPSQPGGAVVGRWFSGTTATSMTCDRCHHTRTHVNAFWDVSTPIVQAAGGAASGTAVNHTGGEAATPVTAGAVGVQGGVKQVVEVEHFAGATATTTTYVNSSSDQTSAAPTPLVAAERATDHVHEVKKKSASGQEASHATEKAGPAVSDEARAVQRSTRTQADTPASASRNQRHNTLQHLLLRVLHPTLNKEVLHGGNQLDCEHCGRRTNTTLTTQLVAEVRAVEDSQMKHGTIASCERSTGPRARSGHTASTCKATVEETIDKEEAEETGRPAEALRNPRGASAPSNQADKAHSAEDRSGASDGTTSTATAAGGGLPWYLAVQLNRFAYQRTTQSLGKITDGVPLNEIVVVPAYPMQDRLAAPVLNPHHHHHTSQVNEDPSTIPADEAQPQHRHADNEEGEAAETPSLQPASSPSASSPSSSSSTGSTGSTEKSVAAVPAWVAYRLQTIIVHSGSTPSSGHYFALTRRPHNTPSAAPTSSAKEARGAEDGGEVVDGRAAMDVSADAYRDAVRSYVNTLGVALTEALKGDRGISSFPPTEAVDGTPNAAAGSAGHAEGGPSAVCKRHEHYENEEHENAEVAVSPAEGIKARPLVKSAANEKPEEDCINTTEATAVREAHHALTETTVTLTTASEQEAAEKTNEEEDTTAKASAKGNASEAQSPLLAAPPQLPAAALSVTDAEFYSNWVMLNDSNVQAVPADTMQRILSGEGGVYSVLETPYLMLYEKVPICFVASQARGDGNEQENEEEAGAEVGIDVPSSQTNDVTLALNFQHVWEHQRADVVRAAPWSASDAIAGASDVELAPEAVAVYQARLNEEEARLQSAASHSTASSTHVHYSNDYTASHTGAAATPLAATAAAAASKGMLIPYTPKADDAEYTGSGAVGGSAVTEQRAERATGNTRSASAEVNSTTSQPRSKLRPLLTASGAAQKSSKRLRAKAAAAYAHCSPHVKERAACRRVTRATASVHSDLDEAAEEGEDEDEGEERDAGDEGDSSDGGVSLD